MFVNLTANILKPFAPNASRTKLFCKIDGITKTLKTDSIIICVPAAIYSLMLQQLFILYYTITFSYIFAI